MKTCFVSWTIAIATFAGLTGPGVVHPLPYADGFEPEPLPAIEVEPQFAKYQNPGNGEEYWLYVPENYTGRTVLVVLSGAARPGTQSAAAVRTVMNWSSIADSDGVIIVAPILDGSDGGWMPHRYIETTDFALAQLGPEVDAASVCGWGFSAGGHVLLDWILSADPDRFAAAGISAGVLAAYAGSSAPVNASRNIPMAVSIGIFDSVLLPHARQDRDTFLANDWSLDSDFFYSEFYGNHQVTVDQLEWVWDRLSPWCSAP